MHFEKNLHLMLEKIVYGNCVLFFATIYNITGIAVSLMSAVVHGCPNRGTEHGTFQWHLRVNLRIVQVHGRG